MIDDLFGDPEPAPSKPVREIAKRKVGRPTKGNEVYNPDTVAEICTRLMGGENLKQICKDEHMPDRRTVLYWIDGKPEFYERYYRAKKVQMEGMIDSMLEISDDHSGDHVEVTDKDGNKTWIGNKVKVMRDRLMVDTRKWIAAHLSPNLYGDKTKIELSGSVGAYDISKLGDEELAQLELILTQVAVTVGVQEPQGLALLGGNQEREPEEEIR